MTRPITFSATPDYALGTIQYAVDGTGTFTLAAHTHDDGRLDESGMLHVYYGAWDGQHHPFFEPLPDAPTVNRVPLHGGSSINPSHALDHIPGRPPWWLDCRRQTSEPFMPTISVPDATRARACLIVQALVQDWAERDDAPLLVQARAISTAPTLLRVQQMQTQKLRVALDEAEGLIDAAVQRREAARTTLQIGPAA